MLLPSANLVLRRRVGYLIRSYLLMSRQLQPKVYGILNLRLRENNTHSISPPVEVSDIGSADRGGLWTLESRFLGTGGLIVSIKDV